MTERNMIDWFEIYVQDMAGRGRSTRRYCR